MVKRFFLLLLSVLPGLTFAHPMGNFSVSHYARFDVKANSVDLTYALDLAELPTFDLLRQWGLERTSPREALEQKAAGQAREWARQLEVTVDGRPVTPKFERAEFVIADGAGNLPIVRITSHLGLDAAPGRLAYEDHNFPDRAGWKEIVIQGAQEASIAKASQGAEDRSKALTEYPADSTVAPPQDVRAAFEWTAVKPVAAPVAAPAHKPMVIEPIPQPKGPPTPAPVTMTTKAAPAGTVVKGDFLSRLLHQRELSLGMILIAIAAAFGLGAAHALTPGHGKTIVAAYLVGSRGTMKHAALLGAMVTFTHTISVFLLGLATLFLFQYVLPEKITQVLGVISGLSIVAIGAWMLVKRLRGVKAQPSHHDHAQGHRHEHDHDLVHSHELAHAHAHAHGLAHSHAHDDDHAHSHDHIHAHDAHAHAHDHGLPHSHPHDHSHTHDHGHTHPHDQEHPHEHVHADGKLVHSHGPGGHVHSHDVPDEITWGSLVALAVSGGLVPCESALVLLLSAIALGRVGLGLMLLVAFSLGLAIVLMGIGILVIYAKHLLPESSKRERHPAFKWVPVASAGVVMIAGLVITAVSLGWLQPKWMI